jgi:uncharacterized damage-inducible protein DinB
VQYFDEFGRPEPPMNANEFETLTGFLDWQRATLEWKTRDLGSLALGSTVANSLMTLGGILKHMAWVEDLWFSYCLHGRQPNARWLTPDALSIKDWEWISSSSDSPEDLREMWRCAVDNSRSATQEALDSGGLDQVALRVTDDSGAPSLRWILIHMIEEYARHNGHADLLRESVDGQVGE